MEDGEAITWTMSRSLVVGVLLTSVLVIGVGTVGIATALDLRSVTDRVGTADGSSLSAMLFGVLFVAGGAYCIYAVRRVQLTLGPDRLFVRNMLRSYRIEYAEITRIWSGPSGVWINYNRDGRSRSVAATAGQGVLNPWVFTKKAKRAQAIADEVQARVQLIVAEPAAGPPADRPAASHDASPQSGISPRRRPHTRRLTIGGVGTGLLSVTFGATLLASEPLAGVLLLVAGVGDIVFIGSVLPAQIRQRERELQENSTPSPR